MPRKGGRTTSEMRLKLSEGMKRYWAQFAPEERSAKVSDSMRKCWRRRREEEQARRRRVALRDDEAAVVLGHRGDDFQVMVHYPTDDSEDADQVRLLALTVAKVLIDSRKRDVLAGLYEEVLDETAEGMRRA